MLPLQNLHLVAHNLINLERSSNAICKRATQSSAESPVLPYLSFGERATEIEGRSNKAHIDHTELDDERLR